MSILSLNLVDPNISTKHGVRTIFRLTWSIQQSLKSMKDARNSLASGEVYTAFAGRCILASKVSVLALVNTGRAADCAN